MAIADGVTRGGAARSMLGLAAALRAGDSRRLPSRRDEDWRWSDLQALLRPLPEPSAAHAGAGDNPVLAEAEGRRVVIANGVADGPADQLVSAGETVRLIRRFVSDGAGWHAAEAHCAVAEGGRLLLIDSFEGAADGRYVAAGDFTLRLAPGATVERLVLLDDGAEAVSVAITEAEVKPGAALRQTVLARGARRQRFETRVQHQGQEAAVRMDGAYLLRDRRHSDQTTIVDHLQPGGAAEQLTKGVAADQARAVFQGRIVVHPGADGTDARMGHHALLLSDRAEVDAKPELEIYADDVSCAHGATVGALDEDALFYAMSRGVDPEAARALLISAFVAEVTDRIEDEGLRAVAEAFLERSA